MPPAAVSTFRQARRAGVSSAAVTREVWQTVRSGPTARPAAVGEPDHRAGVVQGRGERAGPAAGSPVQRGEEPAGGHRTREEVALAGEAAEFPELAALRFA